MQNLLGRLVILKYEGYNLLIVCQSRWLRGRKMKQRVSCHQSLAATSIFHTESLPLPLPSHVDILCEFDLLKCQMAASCPRVFACVRLSAPERLNLYAIKNLLAFCAGWISFCNQPVRRTVCKDEIMLFWDVNLLFFNPNHYVLLQIQIGHATL